MVSLQKLRPQPDDRIDFLRGFLREPQKVGSIIPSSRFLERRIVSLAEVSRAEVVVELGPGTGGTTRAILRALPRTGTLVAIELNQRFVRLLERGADPRLQVHLASAADVEEILERGALAAPSAVISGIPFSTMKRDLGGRIVRAVHDVLAPGGVFVAYQVRDRVKELGDSVFGPAETEREFRNIPPMRVYRWRKPLTQDAAPALA